MHAPLPRPLLVRLADELRARLPVDATTGLPSLAALEPVDEDALWEAGGRRLAAVAFLVESCAAAAALLDENVRRSDLLVCGSLETLVVLAAGLTTAEVEQLAVRLVGLLGGAGMPARVGIAQRTRMAGVDSIGTSVAVEARERASAAPRQAA